MKTLLTSLLAIVTIAALMVAGAGRVAGAHTPMTDATPTATTSTGAAYMTIANSGATADRLIGGKTDVARTVEIHEVVDMSGVMKMQPVEGGLEIPAGGSVELKPGGYHVMLIGLTKSLTAGSTFELTLTFEQAGDVVLTLPVYANKDEAAKATPVAPVTAGALTISNQWSRSAPAVSSGATAAAFMTIANAGTEADTLIAVKTDLAATAEIHEMKKGDDGVMKMAPLANGLEIPAGGTISLEPGGYHVMLIGIMKDFTEGMTYELTLTFEKAGDVTITIPVLPGAPDATNAQPPVTAGSITVSNQWSRPAPAMQGNGEMNMGGDGMNMHGSDDMSATPKSGM